MKFSRRIAALLVFSIGTSLAVAVNSSTMLKQHLTPTLRFSDINQSYRLFLNEKLNQLFNDIPNSTKISCKSLLRQHIENNNKKLGKQIEIAKEFINFYEFIDENAEKNPRMFSTKNLRMYKTFENLDFLATTIQSLSLILKFYFSGDKAIPVLQEGLKRVFFYARSAQISFRDMKNIDTMPQKNQAIYQFLHANKFEVEISNIMQKFQERLNFNESHLEIIFSFLKASTLAEYSYKIIENFVKICLAPGDAIDCRNFIDNDIINFISVMTISYEDFACYARGFARVEASGLSDELDSNQRRKINVEQVMDDVLNEEKDLSKLRSSEKLPEKESQNSKDASKDLISAKKEKKVKFNEDESLGVVVCDMESTSDEASEKEIENSKVFQDCGKTRSEDNSESDADYSSCDENLDTAEEYELSSPSNFQETSSNDFNEDSTLSLLKRGLNYVRETILTYFLPFN